MAEVPDIFRCEVYACRLTRGACAERHRSARAGYRGPTTPSLTYSQCSGCEIGAAHARGERPDVTAAQLVRPKTEVVVEMPKIVKHTHNGKSLALKDWAKEPEAKGLSLTTLRDRVNTRHMTIAEALSAPPRGRGESKPPKSKPAKAAPRARSTIVKLTQTPRAPTMLDEHLAARAALPIAEALTRLGYVCEDVGLVPAGRLILVRESAAA